MNKEHTAKTLTKLVISNIIDGDAVKLPGWKEGSIKYEFHRLGKKVLKEVAEKMGLSPGSFDIRSNKGGSAVSGEITLHGEHIYIQLSQGSYYKMFMYRHCNGRKDYTGGVNRWMDFSELINMEKAVTQFKAEEQSVGSIN
jgi:hypothetical protein